MSWRDTVLHVLRVPHEPTPPPGSPPRVFRAAPNFFTLRLIRFALAQVGGILGIVFAIVGFGVVLRDAPPIVLTIFRLLEALAILVLAVQMLLGWAIVKLDFELRWYMVSDRAIRIREGISTVREKTIALANIQNISVRQGPLQRMLGIADVEVRTAGGGEASAHEKKSMGEPMHVAYFRGVDNAEEIRDLVREGVRRQRDTGLGDPDEQHHHDDDEIREATALLLSEARALRGAVSS